jgi:5-methylcytosine-specific restriction endonuclease McrA
MPIKPPTFRPNGVNVWSSERQRKAALDRTRPSAVDRGYDAAWRAVRNAFAMANPICSVPGCCERTDEVDHIESIRQRPDLRLRWSNLRPFCKSHHSERTAKDQGFGRKLL